MNNHPDAAELLAIARSTLLDKLLPGLPEELRYDALMIANAMAIASREHAGAEKTMHAEFARLQKLLGATGEAPVGSALEESLAGLNQRLAVDIRAGRFDDKERTALLDHLEKTSADELAISNPRALQT
jgi:hypothetical protein